MKIEQTLYKPTKQHKYQSIIENLAKLDFRIANKENIFQGISNC